MQDKAAHMNLPTITLDPELKTVWPETALGCLFWNAVVRNEEPGLWAFFTDKVLPELRQRLEETPLADMPQIGESRRAFKAFGRDPGRVRISSEALYRRVRQGKELYRINSAVDANNLVSLETGYSLGTYDISRLSGDVVLRLGRQGESYGGIGKDEIDLDRMPLLADALGPFGCPCSDSRRAMIGLTDPDAAILLTVVYGFSGPDTVAEAMGVAQKHVQTYAGGEILGSAVVC